MPRSPPPTGRNPPGTLSRLAHTHSKARPTIAISTLKRLHLLVKRFQTQWTIFSSNGVQQKSDKLKTLKYRHACWERQKYWCRRCWRCWWWWWGAYSWCSPRGLAAACAGLLKDRPKRNLMLHYWSTTHYWSTERYSTLSSTNHIQVHSDSNREIFCPALLFRPNKR